MNPRKIRAWAGRVLLAAGMALGILIGTQVAASAAEAAQSDSTTVQMDPNWE